MSSLTQLQARTLVRELAQDTNTTNPACTDSQVNDFIERARQFYATEYPDEMVAAAGTVAALTSTGTLSTTNTFRSIDWAVHGTTGLVLDRDDYVRIYGKQTLDGVAGTPATTSTTFGAIRNAGADNSWSVNVYPISSSGFTATFWGHYEVVPLTGDSDVLLFGQQGSRTICALAALDVIAAAGRGGSPLYSNVASSLPDRIQAKRGDIDRLLKPKPMVT